MSKLLLYCTKAKPRLMISCRGEYKLEQDFKIITDNAIVFNGKVVAECDFDVEKIFEENRANNFFYTKSLDNHKLEEKSCLNLTQLKEYLFKNVLLDKNEKGLEIFYKGYAIHIMNLHIFDKPKETKDYRTYNRNGKVHIANIPIYTAPQNMMYAFDYYGNLFVLISIKPEHLVDILNGNKTIEIRKKILKEMKEQI